MSDGVFNVPVPVNEPVYDYAPGSSERTAIAFRLEQMHAEEIEIPVIIGGREIRTGNTAQVVSPHDHGHVLATCHQAGADEVAAAVKASADAWHEWSTMSWESRAAIFLKAADLLSGPWRTTLNAATILNQSKTVFQAEIDSACELIDFWRFNVHYADQLMREQPASSPGIWNRSEYRALEGFVFAVSPFNFTAIAGNLPTAPAIMGNTVLWKPATTALLSGYYVYKLLEEAGLPPGVINFLPGKGAQVGDPVIADPGFAGVHFTGSTPVFHGMWQNIGNNIARYRSYPRIVGETGGKDFVFAHPSANLEVLATALIRGAFEYQGQKCSAASRAYVPSSLWPSLKERLADQIGSIKMGTPLDFSNFMAAVIDESSFDKISSYVDEARSDSRYELVAGGGCDKSAGYFIQPTLVVSEDPKSRLMSEEIFGPILTLHVYDDARIDEALDLCDTTSPYALTGAIIGDDRAELDSLTKRLRHSAGNFYINDKPTGAVVGQQPFGGSRASGTNDKAGSAMNLLRWTSVRSIKENFVPPTSFAYPHMD